MTSYCLQRQYYFQLTVLYLTPYDNFFALGYMIKQFSDQNHASMFNLVLCVDYNEVFTAKNIVKFLPKVKRIYTVTWHAYVCGKCLSVCVAIRSL